MGYSSNGAHRQWGPVCNGYRGYGYMGNRAHESNSIQGIWGTGDIGHMGNGQWGTWTMGHMRQ